MIDEVRQLSAIRPQVVARAVAPAAVMSAYSGILSEELNLFIQENLSLTNGPVATQSQANISSVAEPARPSPRRTRWYPPRSPRAR